MSGESSRDVLRDLNTLFHCGTTGPQSDSELLECFASGCGETAEAAFAALVERHGKMVLGVCQRVLGSHEAAEDAFQATFLVLARKAASIARAEQLANWLYGVALRAALEARGRAARQKAREARYCAMLSAELPDSSDWSDVRAILDEEVARLPERYRAAIALCELEGLSRRQAAAQLGISEGTLSSRLARAKIQLKDRLIRRGVVLSTAAVGAFLAQDAMAVVVSPGLAESTIQLAGLLSSGSSLAGIVSIPVATLTEGVLKAMLFAKVKSVFFGIATVALVTTGVGALAQTGPSSSDDRLKAVERKLDKVLEVLGGSRRASTVPAASPASNTPADRAEIAPTPGSATSAAVPPPPTTPSPIVASAPAAPPSVRAPGAVPAPPDPPAAASSPRAGLWRDTTAGRLESLEHRLDDLERRLGALERRVQANPGNASSHPSPIPAPDLAPAPAAHSASVGARSLPSLPTAEGFPPLAKGDSIEAPVAPQPLDSVTGINAPSAAPPPPAPASPDAALPPTAPADRTASATPR
jgi:RNA polymerase sigma factor (sigma-70 family)